MSSNGFLKEYQQTKTRLAAQLGLVQSALSENGIARLQKYCAGLRERLAANQFNMPPSENSARCLACQLTEETERDTLFICCEFFDDPQFREAWQNADVFCARILRCCSRICQKAKRMSGFGSGNWRSWCNCATSWRNSFVKTIIIYLARKSG